MDLSMQSPNFSGTLKDPKYIVVHYTASGSFAGTRDWFCNPTSRASAHYLIGRSGEYEQLVALNRCAWHAGESKWKGDRRLNTCSIGIELVSWGPLQQKNGRYFSLTHGKSVPADEVHDGAPTEGLGQQYRYWQKYTELQLARLDEIIALLRAEYPSIVEVVGHRDIAPDRKMDPWPLDAKLL